MIKGKYTNDGFAAVVTKDNAVLIGEVKKDSNYFVSPTSSVVFNETAEGLRAELESKNLKIIKRTFVQPK